ncbi:MAG TPA: hypothetical protein VMU10_07750 [Desulfomonilia bacterium]|nr:hypothetical protein [Desulfomonilia bacterium]
MKHLYNLHPARIGSGKRLAEIMKKIIYSLLFFIITLSITWFTVQAYELNFNTVLHGTRAEIILGTSPQKASPGKVN